MATAPNSENYSQVLQLTDANPDGTIVGQSAADKLGFYGRIPWPQRVVASLSLLTSSSATSTGSIWGAYASSVNGTSSTFSASSYQTSAYASSDLGRILTDVVNTFIGLGIWKSTSA